jgi:hypothetical protein
MAMACHSHSIFGACSGPNIENAHNADYLETATAINTFTVGFQNI